jgi:multidrug resistance efflux pump
MNFLAERRRALNMAVLITTTRSSNAWEGGKIDQETDDAYVRGDFTTLSSKVAGIVRDVKVASPPLPGPTVPDRHLIHLTEVRGLDQ